jgi:hypothetical protein
MLTDRRAYARQDVHRAGRIIFFDEPCYIECTVRNISHDGAQVVMQMALALPYHVVLWEERTGLIYECDVRWRKDCTVGLQFIGLCSRSERLALLERGYLPLSRESPPDGPPRHDPIAPLSASRHSGRALRDRRGRRSASDKGLRLA